MRTVDVIIVGAGTAGLGALNEVRKRTDSFIIINDGPWLALAIHRRSSVVDLLRAPFYHPTVEEGLRTALVGIAKQLPNDQAFPLGSAPAE